MLKDKTPEEYIAFLEEIERSSEKDRAFLDHVVERTNEALAARDVDVFLALKDLFVTEKQLKATAREPQLLKLRYVINAVELETQAGYPAFIDGVDGYNALQAQYMKMTLLLRRIEFDLEPDVQEAYDEIRARRISPYVVAAVLYNVNSQLGHREEILLKIANDALSHGLFQEAYGFLSVIEHPSSDAASLKEELANALEGAAG